MRWKDVSETLVSDDLPMVTQWLGSGRFGIEERDENGRTLLQNAISAGSERITDYLLRQGARVNATNKWGMGALSNAVRAGRLKMLEKLIEAGANIDEADDRGCTPLHQAMLANLPESGEMIKLLLALGANPNKKNVYGMSPREMAGGSASWNFSEFFR